MASHSDKPLVVIVGPTASGKSDLAMKVAAEFNGEIICADSRTIYKGMDVGTAKPSVEDQNQIPHHLLDVVLPGDRFTAYDFQQLALKVIKDIRSRNKLPIMVGGTGLYVDSVIFDYKFPKQASLEARSYYETMSVDELSKYCIKNNIKFPQNYKNKRHLVNSIIRESDTNSNSNSIIDNIIIVGLTTNKEELKQRIMQRSEQMFEQGVVGEAKKLGKIYGWNNEAMTGNIYRLIKDYLNGDLSQKQTIDKFTTLDWRLAKRQITWLKRNKHIKWLGRGQAFSYISDQLQVRRTRTN